MPNFDDQKSSASGLLATQFLSLYNDHTFKQVVLLMMLDGFAEIPVVGGDLQGLAIILFAAPFLLLAGPAGRTSDRCDRRRVIVAVKYVEVALMVMVAIALQQAGSFPRWLMLGLLMAMATQSAFLTPAKYGILLDLVGTQRVSSTNGAMQMLGYLAIVAGAVSGGYLVTYQDTYPWLIGCWLVVVAILGVIASHTITFTQGKSQTAKRMTPMRSGFPGVWKTIDDHRRLRDAMVVYGFLWLIAGLYHPIINWYCISHLNLSPMATSLVLASSVLGIATGCLIAGAINRFVSVVRWLRVAGIAVVVCQCVLAVSTLMNSEFSVVANAGILFALGLLTGLIVLPVHVLIQTETPSGIRGQVMAAQGVVNWSAILMSGLAYQLIRIVLHWLDADAGSMFLVLAVLTATGLLFLRPSESGLLVSRQERFSRQ